MIGRALREQMRLSSRRDTALEVSQRVADAYAREAVHDDMRRRFYPLTASNVASAIAYQVEGLRLLEREVGK